MDTPSVHITELVRAMKPVKATREERSQVVDFFHALADVATGPGVRPPRCAVVLPDGTRVAVPETVFHVLEHVAELLARGDGVTIVPVGEELTTQQAAAILKVSRQYVVKLAERRRLPCVWIGAERRLRLEDVLAFREERDADRRRSAFRFKAGTDGA
jgi:excisionase family DNA binding protein